MASKSHYSPLWSAMWMTVTSKYAHNLITVRWHCCKYRWRWLDSCTYIYDKAYSLWQSHTARTCHSLPQDSAAHRPGISTWPPGNSMTKNWIQLELQEPVTTPPDIFSCRFLGIIRKVAQAASSLSAVIYQLLKYTAAYTSSPNFSLHESGVMPSPTVFSATICRSLAALLQWRRSANWRTVWTFVPTYGR